MPTFAPEHKHVTLDECQTEVDDLRAALTTRPVIEQAKTVLDWTPRIQLKEGLALTVEHFRQLVATS